MGNDETGDGSETNPFLTIQRGIDTAFAGDTVLIHDGTYTGTGNRDMSYMGKDIAVTSENGAEQAIIDCEGNSSNEHRAFVFNSGESSALLNGLTIKNAHYKNFGGAIYCNGSSVNITNCIFENNSNENGYGGAVSYHTGSNGMISNCEFISNTTTHAGGGLSCQNSSPSIENCKFLYNQADYGGGVHLGVSNSNLSGCLIAHNHANDYGGGLGIAGNNPNISNCTIANNSATNYGGGVYCINSTTPTFSNCIIASNSIGGSFYIDGPQSVPAITCSDIFGNSGGDWVDYISDQFGVNGNISLDPLFCDTSNSDFHIFDTSPCATANNECQALIGALDIGCFQTVVLAFEIEAESSMANVIDHTPQFCWSYGTPRDFIQTHFQIGVGIDDDWEFAEMWNPAPYESTDTFVVYAGAPLVEGETYYVRLRIGDDGLWTEWYENSFRMNSVPSVPVQISPEDSSFAELFPTLCIQNSTDPEIDTLCYTFQIWADTEELITESPCVSEQEDSTSWQSDVELIENRQHWWRVKASDYYEESEWSDMVMFYANSINTSPSEFSLIMPPDTSGMPLNTLQPTFYWSSSTDPDPFDSILYTLLIAVDSNFNFFNEVDSINNTELDLPFDLEWGDRYWWKVKAEDQYGGLTWSTNVLNFWTMMCGDAGNDKAVNVSDAVYIINFVFIDGQQPIPYEAGDANCDGVVNVSDAVWIINYVFISGNEPCDTNGDGELDC